MSPEVSTPRGLSTLGGGFERESIYKSRDFFDELVVEPFEWDQGDLIPSNRPGIGIELDREKLEADRGKLADFLRR